MSSDQIPEELRELLSVRVEHEEIDYQRYNAPCYGLSWDKKRSCWIVRLDNKRFMELRASDFPEGSDVRSVEFIDHIMHILREGGPEGLQLHIEEIKCSVR